MNPLINGTNPYIHISISKVILTKTNEIHMINQTNEWIFLKTNPRITKLEMTVRKIPTYPTKNS